MTTETLCFLFNRQKGKFIREIAQEGEDTLFLQKENNEAIMGQGDFADDLTNFIPFRPIEHTEKDEFVGILKVEQIQDWLEEHPGFKLEGALAPLKDTKFDDNPVVVIVEP